MSNKANVIISAGACTSESQDWADMLLHMYIRWAENQRRTFSVPHWSKGSAVLEINDAYDRLQIEKGIHRLIRISPYDNQFRRHTSFALVEVVPEPNNTVTPSFTALIRSYVLDPYTLVKDHRTGKEMSDVKSVLDGNIDLFLHKDKPVCSSLSEALERYWTDDNFGAGKMFDSSGTKFCILGLTIGHPNNPLPERFRWELSERMKELDRQGISLIAINDTVGRVAVIDHVRRMEHE